MTYKLLPEQKDDWNAKNGMSKNLMDLLVEIDKEIGFIQFVF